MSLRTATLFVVVLSSSFLLSQTQAPAPPPQTPRQALIEIITGGEQGAMKHLTVEMQKSLQGDNKNGSSPQLAAFDQIQAASSEFQVFESGQVLLAASDPKSHEKFEVHVDSDDLSGDTDNIDISFHQFRDGTETEVPYAALLSRFTVGLKQQQNVWRLNEISINIKVPLGDPKLLEKFGSGMGTGMFGAKVGGVSASGKPDKPRDMGPREAVQMLGMTESMFARMHPEIGFTCTLSDLAKPNMLNLDPRIFSGEYHGYKFSLSGCQDKPSGSFHLVAEPVSPTGKAKAFCTEATNNVRSSDDGLGSSCLASGKLATSGVEDGAWVGDTVHFTTGPSQK